MRMRIMELLRHQYYIMESALHLELNTMAEDHASDGTDGREEEIPDALQEFLLDDIEVSGRELGVGSYSSVLELRYKGMKCAGKKLHTALYDQGMAIGPEILERFGNECELLSQLRHPCVVQFLGLHFEEGADVPILVLEYMPYALSDCIERYGTFPVEISYSILHHVALGLHFLHDQKPAIIHRDLTANNVLLTSDMTAKISDLGMAKILNIPPANMTRRMTVCPGTLSYMPPESLTAYPRYDTKLDCFSFGVLMIHIFCGEWPLAMEYLQPDPLNPGHLYPLTEVQRRVKYITRLGESHPLLELIHKCLKNLPADRPEASEVLVNLNQIVAQFPASFENKIEMLNQIKSDTEEKVSNREEIDKLQRMLHEKEHKIENLCAAYSVEMERMREALTRLEQTCSLQEAQLNELQTENDRLRVSLSSKQEEVEMMRKRVDSLSNELQAACSKLEEKARDSVQKLKHLQNELVAKSQDREAALQRVTRGHLDSALSHSFQRSGSEALSKVYEDFFLNSADDITELLKKSQRTGSTTHLQAQQMVCDMVQHCYDHCKAKVLQQLVRQMEKLFTVKQASSSDDDQDPLRDTSIAYGLLMRAAHLPDSQQYSEALCEELFPKFLEKHSFRVSSRSTEASLRQHLRQACKTTWDLIATWPPLIVARPPEYREEWHDREFQYWEKSSPNYRLLYTRPVLFLSYEGAVGVKGWVGNKDKGTGSHGVRRGSPNSRLRHKK